MTLVGIQRETLGIVDGETTSIYARLLRDDAGASPRRGSGAAFTTRLFLHHQIRTIEHNYSHLIRVDTKDIKS